VLQIVVVNHPPTTLVPVPLRAINRDCGPLKVIVKGSFLLWPFIGLGGWAIGGFALIVRAKARWARWLTRLTLWLSVVVCRRNGTTLVILVDGHRPTRKRRAKLAARYPDGTPMGDVLRRLHRLLPPRAGGLWMIMETAKRMGLPVKIIGYFTDYPVCPGGAQDVVQLGESAVVVDRQELPELVHCATQEELQTALNQIWLQVDERMR
jgi:1-acyl-sn-glycerol-3-phosphate acyltransferase